MYLISFFGINVLQSVTSEYSHVWISVDSESLFIDFNALRDASMFHYCMPCYLNSYIQV